MIPKKGQFVHVYLNNSFSDSGFVFEWGDKVVLRSFDSGAFTIINDPSDIFAYRILVEKNDQSPVSEVYVEKPLEPTEYRRDPVDRGLHLLELHKLRAEEELKRVRQKLTTFSPNGVTNDNDTILGHKSVLLNSLKKNQ